MFSDELEKISWEETTKAIYSKTEADVIRALGKSRCDVDDFMALISPAAEKFLEPMARLSKKYTEERFGRTMSMFIPLYITNSCTNSCVYCGFHISNPMARTILTPEEIENEYKAIKKLGPFENLLIVTGENPAKSGVCQVILLHFRQNTLAPYIIARHFSHNHGCRDIFQIIVNGFPGNLAFHTHKIVGYGFHNCITDKLNPSNSFSTIVKFWGSPHIYAFIFPFSNL